VDDIHHQHLGRDEQEHTPDAVFEVSETLREMTEDEIEGPQGEDGEDVGSEHQERIRGDGEDGGDGVHGEHDVAELHHQQGREERGGRPLLAAAHEELVSGEPGLEFHEELEEPHKDVLFRVDLFLISIAALEHLEPGIGEKPSEEVEHRTESLDQLGAGHDEAEPEDHSSDDPPLQRAFLLRGFQAEEGEDHREDHEVVDAEHLFDHVAGEEERGLLGRLEEGEAEAEQPGQTDENAGVDEGFLQAHLVSHHGGGVCPE